MADIRYGLASYRRDNGNMPEFRVVNMLVEKTPSASEGVTLLSQPGLILQATRGAGPIQGLFLRSGVLNGDIFTISGGDLYRGNALLGTIPGTGPVSWAASAIELVVTRGGAAYSYNGTNLVAIAFPDGANVTAVEFVGGLFIFARQGTHRFYWSAVLDARTIDGLDYASAESSPDRLLDIKAIGDNLYLLGQSSIELWVLTGELNLPFNRVTQRIFSKGVIATACAEEVDNTLYYVGHDDTVYAIGDVPQRISDHGIEERIRKSATISCFSYTYEGHAIFVVRLANGTWCYDANTGQWFERQSYGNDNWRAQCATMFEDIPVFGDDTTGTVWEFGGWLDGDVSHVRTFTAAFQIKGGAIPVDVIEVDSNTGATDDLIGIGADPHLEMRSSRDAGRTWSAWRTTRLGAQGEGRTRARYRRCGYFDTPGALFEFRCSDPAPLRISAVRVNEAGGGRAR
ncbi:MAG: packaged DNA stabilization protein [Pseudomonadota bacterium]